MGILFLGIVLLISSFVVMGMKAQLPNPGKVQALAFGLRGLAIVVLIVGAFSGGFVQVPSGYRAVLLRFGAVKGVLNEGLNFVVPGMDTVVLMETRTQKEESQATAASRDLQTVTTSLAINFRIDPAKVGELYTQVGTSYKERIIAPAAQESVKVVTARYTAEELIRQRAQVKTQVEEEITKRLRQYNLIVEPSGLSITNFDFSPEFNKAIEAKQVAQQEAEKQKYVLAQAELQKQTEIARAQGMSEAAKLNAAALQVQGGSLVIAREWIEKWDGRLPQVSSGSGTIIDVRELMRQADTAPRR